MDPVSLSVLLLFGGWGCILTVSYAICYIDKFLKRKVKERDTTRITKYYENCQRIKYYRIGANDVLDNYLPLDVKNIVMNYYDSITRSMIY